MNEDQAIERIRSRFGFLPAESNRIQRALRKRMRATAATDPRGYLESQLSVAAEMGALIEELMVRETWFFREPETLQRVTEQLLRREARRQPSRVLSAACSSGEEIHSLAMLLHSRGVSSERVSLEGLDISRVAVDRARQGLYTAASVRQTDPWAGLQGFYLRPEAGGKLRLNPTVGSWATFRVEDLRDQNALSGGGPYNVILCRHLLIYLDETSRANLFALFHRKLATGGLLALAQCEMGTVPRELFVRRSRGSEPLLEKVTGGASEKRKSPARPPERLPNAAPATQASPELSLHQQAMRLADIGRLEEAAQVCRLSLLQHGPQAEVYQLLGLVLSAAGQLDRAEESLRKALFLEPYHHDSLSHLAFLLEKRGRLEDAAALRRRIGTAGRD